MQWNWASSIDDLWHSPALPMWATLAAATFSALIVLIVLLRADKTMANGALAVITLLSIGIAATLAVNEFSGGGGRSLDVQAETRPVVQQVASVPALACLDGLAGDSVESACEKAVFGSADAAAAAVSYTAAQISRLAGITGARSLTPDQQILRTTLERDRYGLVAQVLTVREKCTPADCSMFRIVSDASNIRNNMTERLYDTLILRHSTSWAAAHADGQTPAVGLFGGTTTAPSGKPTNVDFPTASSTPPVNIMTPEPSPPAAAASAAPTSAPTPAPAAAVPLRPAVNEPSPKQTPKRQAAPKGGQSRPTQLAPKAAAQPSISARTPYVPPQ